MTISSINIISNSQFKIYIHKNNFDESFKEMMSFISWYIQEKLEKIFRLNNHIIFIQFLFHILFYSLIISRLLLRFFSSFKWEYYIKFICSINKLRYKRTNSIITRICHKIPFFIYCNIINIWTIFIIWI